MNRYDINKLTIEQKIGQLLMVGFDGYELTDVMEELIEKHHVGNVILFARNIKNNEQLFNLNKKIHQKILKSTGVTGFISIDQEGGMVTRIQREATFFPGAMTIAATDNIKNAYWVGKQMGKELEAFLINLNLAPVLDVNNNPKNPVIGVRSYSDNPNKVKDYANMFIKGMQEHVIATGKHFPGHGDTNVDSHLALPKVNHDLMHLEENELIPFVSAVNNGIKALMSSHIDYPALTKSDLPVTISSNALDFLRNDLGFEGLIITDGIEMKAIDSNYGAVEATLMAIKAGANLVCICRDEQYQLGAITRIKEALKTGEITEELINERVKRVLAYKESMRLNINNSYDTIKNIVNDKENQQKAYKIVSDAVTLIKGSPIKLKEDAALIGILPLATTIADENDGENKTLDIIKNEIPSLHILKSSLAPTNDDIKEIINSIKTNSQIILLSYNGNVYKEQITLIDELSKLNIELHIIAMRNPYDLFYTNKIKNYVAFYEYTPNSIKALIKYLKGELKPRGKAPIKYE